MGLTKVEKKLFAAVESENVANVRLAIDSGADVNAEDKYGYIPLHYANTKEIIKLLIEAGADVNTKNNDDWTPLHIVRTKEIAEVLIAAGADVNAKNNNGATP